VTDDLNNTMPVDETANNEHYQENGAEAAPSVPEAAFDSAQPPAPALTPEDEIVEENYDMNERLERLGGEPAPAITPEEFARLQKAGQVHIDERGRVRTARRSDAEGGVSLKKRRAWYG